MNAYLGVIDVSMRCSFEFGGVQLNNSVIDGLLFNLSWRLAAIFGSLWGMGEHSGDVGANLSHHHLSGRSAQPAALALGGS